MTSSIYTNTGGSDTQYKLWSDVIKLITEIKGEIYKEKKKKNPDYTPQQAMSEAYKTKEYDAARKEYLKFKKDFPEEYEKLREKEQKRKQQEKANKPAKKKKGKKG